MKNKFYHRTTREAAELIVKDGFHDSTGYYLTSTQRTGVWLSDVPLDENEGAKGGILLEVSLSHDALKEMAKYEWVEHGKGYREWLIPAAALEPMIVKIRILEEDGPY